MAEVAFKPIPGSPDFSKCSARLSGFGDYVDCLSEDAFYCVHAIKFGDCYLCFHPERDKTVARTLASAAVAGVVNTGVLRHS